MASIRISLEGLIGVGKSTVLNILNDIWGLPVAPEPVNQWTLLHQFYEDTPRYALAFESQVLCSYAHSAFHGHSGRPLIMERSPESAYHVFGRLLASSGALTMPQYDTMGTLYSTLPVARADAVVYLSAPPEVCLRRLAWRDRANEASRVSSSYLRDLDMAYRSWLSGPAGLPYKIIDLWGDEEPKAVARMVAEAVEELRAPQNK